VWIRLNRGKARKHRSFSGIELRATDSTSLFLHNVTSSLPDSTGFEDSSLLGYYIRVQLVNCYQQLRLESSSALVLECQPYRHRDLIALNFNGLYDNSQLIELWLNKSPNQVTKHDVVLTQGCGQQDVTFTYVSLVIIRWRCHVRRCWAVWFDRSWYARVFISVLITF
jgi:hypothetical protein